MAWTIKDRGDCTRRSLWWICGCRRGPRARGLGQNLGTVTSVLDGILLGAVSPSCCLHHCSQTSVFSIEACSELTCVLELEITYSQSMRLHDKEDKMGTD